MHVSTSMKLCSKHAKPHLDPILDMGTKEISIYVSVDIWMSAVSQFPQDTLAKWTAVIKARGFFEDPDISTALDEFCHSGELARCASLSRLLDRLFVLAETHRDEFVELPAAMGTVDLVYLEAPMEQSELADQTDVAEPRDTESIHRKGQIGVSWNKLSVCLDQEHDVALTEKLEKRRSVSAAAQQREENPSEPPQPAAIPAVVSTGTSRQGSESRKREVSTQEEAEESPCKRPRLEKSSTESSSVREKTVKIAVAETQMASYGLEVSASTDGTWHDIWIFMRDARITLWYFDASGVVRVESEPAPAPSIIDHFEKVSAIFIALSYSSPKQFGASPIFSIRPPENEQSAGAFRPVNLNGNTVNFLASDQTSPNGAAPKAIAPGDDARPVMVTLGDHSFLHYVNAPRHVVSKTSEAMDAAKTYAVVNHVPDISHDNDSHKLSNGIQKHLVHNQEDPYDTRVQRCIVTENYVPLRERLAENPDSIKTMVRQILTCIHDLRYKAHILHRDVNFSNIMWTSRGGEDCFILNESDLAVRVDELGKPLGPTSRHRTGTLPFMSPELLHDMHAASLRPRPRRDESVDSTIHCVRMDYESTALVAVWSAMKTVKDGTSKSQQEADNYDRYLKSWGSGTYESMALVKKEILHDPNQAANLPLSPLFAHLNLWFEDLLEPFKKGEVRRKAKFEAATKRARRGMNDAIVAGDPAHPTAPSFEDRETMYDEVTLKHFLDVLDEYEKEQASKSK